MRSPPKEKGRCPATRGCGGSPFSRVQAGRASRASIECPRVFAASALELRKDLSGKRCVEVLWDDEPSLLRSQHALAQRRADRNETLDGPARPRDHDIFSRSYALQEP